MSKEYHKEYFHKRLQYLTKKLNDMDMKLQNLEDPLPIWVEMDLWDAQRALTKLRSFFED